MSPPNLPDDVPRDSSYLSSLSPAEGGHSMGPIENQKEKKKGKKKEEEEEVK